MLRFVGVGEQAGSGIPKIYAGWASQHWSAPSLYEKSEPYNQTLLELRMIDLLPQGAIAALRDVFGDEVDELSEPERVTLVTVYTEQVITHARMRDLTGLHPVDVTRLLATIVKKGFLVAHNWGRGTVYCLPGADLPRPEEVFVGTSQYLHPSSELLGLRYSHSAGSSEHFSPGGGGELRDEKGRLLSDHLDAPVIDVLEEIAPHYLTELEAMAAEPRKKKKVSRDLMRQTIVKLCEGQYVTLQSLAQLVLRDPDALRQQYLSPLVKEGRLRLAFPTAPTHARQAYSSD
jgi:ATP-dependent DNA helicase RecG